MDKTLAGNKTSHDSPAEKTKKDGKPPNTCTSNNPKEKTLLGFARNFQRQFRQLYGDRKFLFSIPPNEFGIEKFVCSTIQPTQLPYKELYDFDGCASFVADYLTYESLQIPNELPTVLRSPALVLSEQTGSCFEYSVLLTSLLIGAGYDAYCVCGYATKEVTVVDQTRNVCPSLKEKEKEEEEAVEGRNPKYTVKPPRDLTSKFLAREKQKEKDKLAAEEEKRKEDEAARLAELEKPPPDKYHGLRYHCWVLVLSGKREIGQSFFIEPTTGETQALDWEQYLGIETLWNHKNYWVNMQDCSQGVGLLVYDLGDATKWEYFFPNVEAPLLTVPGGEKDSRESDDDEEEEEDSAIKDYFELPPSWVEPITVSEKDYETRYPRGRRTVLYYRSKMEKFAPYLNQDGLVLRLTQFRDSERRDKFLVKEEFLYRGDKLTCRSTNLMTGQIVESFAAGRKLALKEHAHYGQKGFKADNHTMNFYHNARIDGLCKREVTPLTLTEHYVNRPDKLHYREVIYGKPLKKFEPAEKDKLKHIQKITERFHRNEALSANDDIAQLVYLLDENKIVITYHYCENRVTASTREFYLPVLTGEQAQPLTMNPDMTSSYQVDLYSKELKQRVLFEFLEKLVSDQDTSTQSVRASDKEMEDILSIRQQEERSITLGISVYDVRRNETARLHKLEQEQLQMGEERIRQEKEKDYLAPFLARIGDKLVLTREEKERVREECLQDLRTRLVDVANIIQSHFEKESEDLQKKQSWYKQKQSNISKEEEAEYISYCSEAMFRLHILEQRLNRHKTTAPQKYLSLERRLQSDARLK